MQRWNTSDANSHQFYHIPFIFKMMILTVFFFFFFRLFNDDYQDDEVSRTCIVFILFVGNKKIARCQIKNTIHSLRTFWNSSTSNFNRMKLHIKWGRIVSARAFWSSKLKKVQRLPALVVFLLVEVELKKLHINIYTIRV